MCQRTTFRACVCMAPRGRSSTHTTSYFPASNLDLASSRCDLCKRLSTLLFLHVACIVKSINGVDPRDHSFSSFQPYGGLSWLRWFRRSHTWQGRLWPSPKAQRRQQNSEKNLHKLFAKPPIKTSAAEEAMQAKTAELEEKGRRGALISLVPKMEWWP